MKLMKKNNKAFTLIELLAIIVILAIIAVITVPIILNIIENSRRGAVTDSAYGYKDAVSKWYISKLQDDTGYTLDGNYTISDGKLGDILIPTSGDKPSGGYLNYSNNALIGGCLVFGEYEAVFDSKGSVSSTQKGSCVVKYTVTFDSKGGNSVESQQVSAGGKVQEPTNVTNGSLALDGWYTDDTFTQKFDFNNTVSSNMTLYAYWLEPKYFSFYDSDFQNSFLGTIGSCYNDTGICYGNNITKITVSKKLDIPEGAPTFDFNENVKAWLVDDGNNNGMYELKIGANGQPRPEGDMSNLFAGIPYISYVNFDGMDANRVTYMNDMFIGSFGNVSGDVTVDFGNNFNANNAEITGMFNQAAYGSSIRNFNINLGNNFNASSATNAYDMFTIYAQNININLGNNFNAVNLITASQMFDSLSIGKKVNIGPNFGGQNVTDAYYMFYGIDTDILDISSMNLSGLQSYDEMFNCVNVNKIIVKDENDKNWLANKAQENSWFDNWMTYDYESDEYTFDASHILVKE